MINKKYPISKESEFIFLKMEQILHKKTNDFQSFALPKNIDKDKIKEEIDEDYINFVLNESQKNAKKIAFFEEQKYTDKVLKKCKSKSLGKIVKGIQMARKPVMRVSQQYLCDSCNELIVKPDDGFVVQGNIYTANPAALEGLIGNNFPDQENFKFEEVQKNVFCKKCFSEHLNLISKKLR